MTSYARMGRRRVEAAFRVRVDRSRSDHAPLEPVMDDPVAAVPAEVIDLATGPFQARFPELVNGHHRGRR
jgi:hypothetical protein